MKLVSVLTVLVMVFATFSGIFQTAGAEKYFPEPVEQAATWAPLVPMKNAFIVRYDPESYIDDYSYMASVPAAVFYDKSEGVVYGSPLLYWEPSRGLSGENLPQESAVGIDYFMQDWLNYSSMQLDNVQYMNMASDEIEAVQGVWGLNASSQRTYSSDDPYTMAKNIALYNWKSSDTVVVAVINKEFPEMDDVSEGSVGGTIPGKSPKTVILEGEKEPSPVKPNMHTFTIEPDYKYVTSSMEWFGPAGTDNINSVTQRGRDPDLQLYDMSLGEVAASEEWNVLSGVGEYVASYVYNEGQWASAVSYMPTKEMSFALDETEGKDASDYPQPIKPVSRPDSLGDLYPPKPGSKVAYVITNTMYPGMDIELPDETPFMAKDGEFTLQWSGSAKLGLLVRGPSDAIIAEDLSDANPKTVTVKDMGQGQYEVTAIRLDQSTQAVTFNVTYKWHQYHDESYGDAMASAAEGAVLASVKNIPLLYASTKGLPSATKKALDTLGAKKVILVDLNGHSKGRVEKAIKASRSWLQPKISVEKYTKYEDIYSAIKDLTNTNYIVFTTVDPHSYWAVDKGPIGEEPKGLFVGPAAYSGAIHGCPVLITDNHPALSTSVAWNNAYWVDAYAGRYPPSVGAMVLTGKAVYEFLDSVDLDDPGMEYMMTVAEQFDIGTSWDRTFVGAAVPGRIMGTPIDTSQWIARSALYTAMVFANPAVSAGGQWYTTGSSSKFVNGLLPIEPEHEINAPFPVVQTWVSYQHRFNERGSIYWGADYITADGITPYESASGNDIDINQKWPDLTTSEIVPHYSKKAGYTPVFSTEYEATMENLNKGSLMWLEVMHGGNRGAGVVGFWDPTQNPNEPNPWRGYESGGSTFEPDTVIMGKNIGFDVLRNPTRSDRFHDGVIIAIVDQSFQTKSYDGYAFDQSFDNLHSMGFNGGSCLIANTYMHLTMMRHGMVFQVIDPWLTSWYATFAMEAWLRDMVLGYSVGEAYQHGIQHVGIQYLVEQWWWDIFENVIYYGDPALRVYMPVSGWNKPPALPYGYIIGGHTPHGTPDHPNKVKSTTLTEYLIIGGIVAGIAALISFTAFKIITRPKKPKKAKKGKGAGKAGAKNAIGPSVSKPAKVTKDLPPNGKAAAPMAAPAKTKDKGIFAWGKKGK